MRQVSICSFNVNGLRAAAKAGFGAWLAQERPDVICIQETRAPGTVVVPYLASLGYAYVYHSPANKAGYSGTCIASRKQATGFELLTDIPKFDAEGRFAFAKFGDIGVVSAYVPNGNASPARLRFKLEYLEYLTAKCEQLVTRVPRLLICADFNIAHTENDVANAARVRNKSGFLAEERALMDRLMKIGIRDPLRLSAGNTPGMYTWWASHSDCRARNVGWRFDYILSSDILLKQIRDPMIHADVRVSDHCPVSVRVQQ